MELEQIYVNKLKKLSKETNFRQHSEGDCLLCKLLRELGYEKVVEEYENIPKYYPSLNESEVVISNFLK